MAWDGWVAIVVVVCGKICGKICGKCVVKLKNCLIGTKIGVVVDIDHVIMIVVTKRQKYKKAKRQKDKMAKIQKYKKAKGQKGKKAKRQKDENTKIQQKKGRGPKGPPCPPQELEQGGHRPPKF